VHESFAINKPFAIMASIRAIRSDNSKK